MEIKDKILGGKNKGKLMTSVYQTEVVDMHNTKLFNSVTASFYIIVKTGQTSDSLYSS